MFWDNFVRLCNQAGKYPNTVAAEVGVKSTGTVTGWKNGANPRQTVLLKLADYFGVTVEYLLTGEQKENPTSVAADGVDELDKEAMNIMHQLPPEKRAAGLAMLRGLLNN
uniref:Helix-turn-helix domain protein n=1 Tax=Ackermannviridae sp. TaxID=2831612 RepID=A0A8S5RTU1_9CAUD|nr:MAG TPA: helix-turn-helix domain protein [Ackermannviridae sp.]